MKGDTITFGADSKLTVTIPDGFLEQKENRKVEFPIVTATTSWGFRFAARSKA